MLLAEEPIGSGGYYDYFSAVLAAERTTRRNPLNGFKKYYGGWNLSDTNYWGLGFCEAGHYYSCRRDASPDLLRILVLFFGLQTVVYLLVVFGWILVTGTFILSGTFILLHNVAVDTCVAMDQWVQFPTAHTALDDVLSCMDKITAQETLVRNKEVTHDLINLINEVITNVSNINFSPNFKPMYYNQTGPLVPLLCNPVYPDMTDRPCSAGEVDLNNATQVWSSYVCQVSSDEIGITTGRITPTLYSQMSASISSSLALYDNAPFLVSLEDYSIVRETFRNVVTYHCPRLKQHSKQIFIGLVMVSSAVMLSVVFWVIYGSERRHRAHTRQLMIGLTESQSEKNPS